ncbi:MAG: sugar transferase, partial [Myxococcota bacterium]
SSASRRLSMRPGLTCLWQLRDLPAPCPDECAKLDLQYVDGWSLRTDLKILALTLPAVLRSSDT